MARFVDLAAQRFHLRHGILAQPGQLTFQLGLGRLALVRATGLERLHSLFDFLLKALERVLGQRLAARGENEIIVKSQLLGGVLFTNLLDVRLKRSGFLAERGDLSVHIVIGFGQAVGAGLFQLTDRLSGR